MYRRISSFTHRWFIRDCLFLFVHVTPYTYPPLPLLFIRQQMLYTLPLFLVVINMPWELCKICKQVNATPNHVQSQHNMTWEHYKLNYLKYRVRTYGRD